MILKHVYRNFSRFYSIQILKLQSRFHPKYIFIRSRT